MIALIVTDLPYVDMSCRACLALIDHTYSVAMHCRHTVCVGYTSVGLPLLSWTEFHAKPGSVFRSTHSDLPIPSAVYSNVVCPKLTVCSLHYTLWLANKPHKVHSNKVVLIYFKLLTCGLWVQALIRNTLTGYSLCLSDIFTTFCSFKIWSAQYLIGLHWNDLWVLILTLKVFWTCTTSSFQLPVKLWNISSGNFVVT